MRPFAEASDNHVVLAPEITESAAKKRPAGVRRLVDDLLGRKREVTVVCTHRPVMPFVLEAISKRSPHRVVKRLPKENPYLRTAEVLVLQGRTIGERVARYGPFVMNTRDELAQAVDDYQHGRLGVVPPNALMPHVFGRS